MSTKEKYFNFPVPLLQRFLEDKRKVLDDICDYAIYAHSLNLDDGTPEERIRESIDFFCVKIPCSEIDQIIKGKEIMKKFSVKNPPMVGINLNFFWDFYDNNKTDFEKVTLLGFLAVKSILQQKSYCKITNNFWLSRMDGKAKCINEVYELSEPMKKYANIYQTRKIKSELERNWNLKTVAGRGFNVSFKMSIDDLTYEVYKKRKKYLDQEIKKSKDEAKKEALRRLYG